MRTEDLIVDLASRAAPVQPLRSPVIRFVAWSGVAAVCALAGLAAFGPRAHSADLLSRPELLATAIVSFGTAALAALAALVMAIPGAKRALALNGSALVLLAAWAMLLVAGLNRAGEGFPDDTHWPVCFIRVVAIGVMPACALFGMLRRAAPLRLVSTGALAAIAAMAAAAGVMQFTCPLDGSAHGLRGHFAPVVAAAVLGACIAPRLLRRRLEALRREDSV